jgi:hypothetical protein
VAAVAPNSSRGIVAGSPSISRVFTHSMSTVSPAKSVIALTL